MTAKIGQLSNDTHRLLHCEKGHDLQQMVLNHIADDAILVKVTAPAFCAEILTEYDLEGERQMQGQWARSVSSCFYKRC